MNGDDEATRELQKTWRRWTVEASLDIVECPRCRLRSAKNTDVEIWRKVPDDYYSPSIHITEQGDIGINVGGHVLVAPIEQWFAAGVATFVCKNGG
jgi:hypothetical protein